MSWLVEWDRTAVAALLRLRDSLGSACDARRTGPRAAERPLRLRTSASSETVGASWAAYYPARGFDVVATNPGPQAEANLRKYVDDAWPLLRQVGLSPAPRVIG